MSHFTNDLNSNTSIFWLTIETSCTKSLEQCWRENRKIETYFFAITAFSEFSRQVKLQVEKTYNLVLKLLEQLESEQ